VGVRPRPLCILSLLLTPSRALRGLTKTPRHELPHRAFGRPGILRRGRHEPLPRLELSLPRNQLYAALEALVALANRSTSMLYQSEVRLTYRLNDYINRLSVFDGASLGVWRIESTAIEVRVLSVVVPKGSITAAQKAAIEAAALRAQAFGIDLTITPF
jgi:hypothetical protein